MGKSPYLEDPTAFETPDNVIAERYLHVVLPISFSTEAGSQTKHSAGHLPLLGAGHLSDTWQIWEHRSDASFRYFSYPPARHAGTGRQKSSVQ